MYNYTNAYVPANFTAEVLSVEWLLSPSSNVFLQNPTNTGVQLVVGSGGVLETVELQCRVTFTYGVVKVGTMQIRIGTDTYPSRVIVSGDNAFTQPGTKNYSGAFDTQEYTGELQSVAWTLQGDGAAIASQDSFNCSVRVDHLPEDSDSVSLTCTATFVGGHTVVGTKVIDIAAATRPESFDIIGPANYTQQGTGYYEADWEAGPYTDEVVGFQWVLSPSENIGIIDLPGNDCEVRVDNIPDEDEQVTLQCIITWASGAVMTETKTITISATSIPDRIDILGVSQISEAGTQQFTPRFDPAEYTAEMISANWAVTAGAATITQQSTAGCTLQVSQMPITAQTVTLSCVYRFAGNRDVRSQKTIVIDAATRPASLSIDGAAVIDSVGTGNYSLNVPAGTYTDPITSCAFTLTPQNEYASINSQSGQQCGVNCAALPDNDLNVTLQCLVTFGSGATMTATKQITVKATSIPESLTINGAASINAAGSTQYTKTFTPAQYEAELLNVAWEVSAGAATISAQSAEGCTLNVAQMPAAQQQVTLTCTASFAGNRTVVGTKTIVIDAATLPTAVTIEGMAGRTQPGESSYSVATTGEYTAEIVSRTWSLQSTDANITIDGTTGQSVNLNVAVMPQNDETVTLQCVVTFSNGQSMTATKTVEIAAAVYPIISVAGTQEVNEAGSYVFTRNAAVGPNVTAEIQTSQWSLSASENADIASQEPEDCTIAVSAVPATAEVLTLTCTTTFTNGHVDTKTFEITLQQQQVDPEWVDLGLPSGLLWRNRNLNAEVETDFGDYYQWGDTEGHAEGSGYDFNQANYNAKGLNNISTDLTLAQDAANVALGGSCRMPTRTEFQELYDNCNSAWVTENGVAGRRFTSKTNGNSIFFPAAGRYDGTTLRSRGSYGRYWSASRYSDSDGYGLYFDSGGVNPQNYGSRGYGFSVRAVKPAS